MKDVFLRWVRYGLMVLLGVVGLWLTIATAAHADTTDQAPPPAQPSQPFGIYIPTQEELNQQFTALVQGAQEQAGAAQQQAQTEASAFVEQVIAPAIQPYVSPPAPTAAPEPTPGPFVESDSATEAEPRAPPTIDSVVNDLTTAGSNLLRENVNPLVNSLIQPGSPPPLFGDTIISPEADQAIVDNFGQITGMSIPDAMQHALDPALDTALKVTRQGGWKPPIDHTDKSASLAEQANTTANMFIVREVAPDTSVCGDPATPEEEVACAAGITVESGVLGDLPTPRFKAVPRYGAELAEVLPSVCGTVPFSGPNYCGGRVYMHQSVVMDAWDSHDGRPTNGETAGTLLHEVGHYIDDQGQIRRLGVGIRETMQTDEDEAAHERIADFRAGYGVRTAIQRGYLPEEASGQFQNFLVNITPEGTVDHNSPADRVKFAKQGEQYALENLDPGDYSLVA